MSLSFLDRFSLAARVGFFRLLETAAELRKPAPPLSFAAPSEKHPRSLWVFVSTIGELNAIQPLLDALLDALGQPPLTLISDRTHYGPSYLTKYPMARVELTHGSWRESEALARRSPPLMLVVAEIPGLLHDAPCRFSFALQAVAQRAGAPAVLVNGWLYGYEPQSRMDALERSLFGADYLRGFALLLVQTPAVKAALQLAGARAGDVEVVGNLKFDAMTDAYGLPAQAPLLDALRARRGGPLLVAGSVTETADQQAVLQALEAVKEVESDALLILAPRHPENVERMQRLLAMLRDSQWRWTRRSEHNENPAAALQADILILDTMGELRGCYAQAAVAFVGTDHNVLEPLAFGTPVFVADGWQSTYPSYPVYQQMLEAGGLRNVGPIQNLGAAWADHFRALRDGAGDVSAAQLQAALRSSAGAMARSLAALRRRKLLPAPANSAPTTSTR